MRFPDLLKTDEDRHRYDAFCLDRATLLRDSIDLLLDAWRATADHVADLQCPSHTTVLLQCRNEIDMLDGIELLVRGGSSFNCFHLLRSAMEGYWGILWVLNDDTERRGKAYQVGHAHRAIEYSQRLDRRTKTNEQLRKSLAGQQYARILESGEVDADAILEKKATLLAEPEYAEIEKAWQEAAAERKKKKRPGPPAWYSLFGGPQSIRGLAYAVNEGFAYETIYALHSDSVHASNALDHIAPAPEGEDKPIRPLRHPGWLSKVTNHSVNIACGLAVGLLSRYAPEQGAAYHERYVVNLRPRIRVMLDGLDSDPHWPCPPLRNHGMWGAFSPPLRSPTTMRVAIFLLVTHSPSQTDPV